MKEFSAIFDKSLVTGLRSDYRAPKNSMQFVLLENLKPIESGLVAVPTVETQIETAIIGISGQLFQGREKTFLCKQDGLYTIDTTTFEKTFVPLYDSSDPTNLTSVTSGGTWHFVDCYDTWFLLNGSCVAYHTNEQKALGLPDKNFCQTSLTLTSGCEFRGRVLFGGLDPSNYISNDWTTFWETWNNKVATGLVLSDNMAANFVTWSSIGGGDLLWPLALDKAISGIVNGTNYNVDKPYLMDVFKRNQAGFIPMPFQGTVRCLKSMSEGVVVYCDNGIGLLYPVTTQSRIPTFGYRTLSTVGICSRGSVDGDEDQHVFIDKRGYLWRLTNKDLTRLGYLEFFSPMLARSPTISYDPGEEEFYISSDTETYILTKTGLCKCSQWISSVIQANGQLIGYANSVTNAIVACETDTFDMQNRGMKRINFVELLGDGMSGLQLSAKYKYDNTNTYATSNPVTVGQTGAAYLGIAGTDFRLVINGIATSLAQLDAIIIHWQQSDKRFVRSLQNA